MAASEPERVPGSLYAASLSAIIPQYNAQKKDMEVLPDSVQLDVCYELYKKGEITLLGKALCDLDVMERILEVRDKRHLLHQCFQAAIDNYQPHPATALAYSYARRCCPYNTDDTVNREKCIRLGITLARFLSDSGRYCCSRRIYSAALQLTKSTKLPHKLNLSLEICLGLVDVNTANCEYNAAELGWREATSYMAEVEKSGKPVCKALFYATYGALLYSVTYYDRAYRYCSRALKAIQQNDISPSVRVYIFRQCAKVCVVERQFKRAEILIKYAVQVARDKFGIKHHKYADALLDYGFYLKNVDALNEAVEVYQAALDIRVSVFGGNNLHVAVAHEDLAYSLYARDYRLRSSTFQDAMRHIDCSRNITKKILPQDHFLLVSSNRVKAAILEEIGVDSPDIYKQQRLLQEAKELYCHSLGLVRKVLDEDTFLIAKLYGNLGRLYQSMENYKEAEMILHKAIEMKERILGVDHYEYALSVDQLASLYAYGMHNYAQAEHLYTLAISIERKLFGPGYSGLEFAYRGLIALYRATDRFAKVQEYRDLLQEWKDIRERSQQNAGQPLDLENQGEMSDVVARFFRTKIFIARCSVSKLIE